MTAEAFFREAAETMAGDVPMERDALFRLLMERERASSTVLAPGLAIPHIIIEGEHVFDILIARSRQGIAFSPSAPQVHAIFVLMGSMDERNFHLRALAAIAQIVQDPRFEKRWMSARSKESLRDIVLLGKRLRH
jgi:mannitol/fructose-specific phosphotransferase system IIA component (Ntr-type)